MPTLIDELVEKLLSFQDFFEVKTKRDNVVIGRVQARNRIDAAICVLSCYPKDIRSRMLKSGVLVRRLETQ